MILRKGINKANLVWTIEKCGNNIGRPRFWLFVEGINRTDKILNKEKNGYWIHNKNTFCNNSPPQKKKKRKKRDINIYNEFSINKEIFNVVQNKGFLFLGLVA